MGSSDGSNALVIVSAQSSKMAPEKKQAGISTRLSGPTMNRRRCGIIRPTKPIIPETETQIAVISEAAIRRILRVLSVSTPKVSAVRDPKDIILRSRA